MKKRVTALFLAALLGLSVTACGAQDEIKEAQSVSVSGILPETGDVIVTTTYIGTVEPKESITVYPMVDGNITQISAALGKEVKKGEALFTLDNAEANKAVSEAQEEYDVLKKAADQAKKDAEQAKKDSDTAKKEAEEATKKANENELKLLEEKMNSAKKEMDNAKVIMDDAEDDWDKLEKELEELEDKLEDAKTSEKDEIEDDIEDKEDECKTAKSNYNSKKSKYTTAQKAYETAKSNYEKAKKEATENNKTTSNDSSTSTTDKTDSVTSVGTAVTTIYDQQLVLAEKKLNEAKALLELYQVKSPIDGTVEAVYIEQNEKAFVDEPCLVISNKSNIEVTFQVPEAVALALNVGERVKVEKNGGMHEASITEIGLMADAQTKLFKVNASLGAVAGFSTGTDVKVYAETQKVTETLKIPYDSLYFQGGDAYVYCVVDDEAVRRPVQVGIMNDESAQILEGLEKTDIVISTWSSQLKDGVAVDLLFVIGNSDTVDVPQEEEETPQITDDSDPVDTENAEEELKWELPDWD